MKKIGILTLAIVILAATGCAFNPQEVNFQPRVASSSSDIGAGVSVYVKVSDERADKALGRRGTAYGAAAAITSKEDLSVIVREEIEKGLKVKGFTIQEINSADNKLIVEIRGLEYSTSQGFFTGGVHIKGAFKGRASNESSELEKMYRYEKEERIVIVPTAETNEQWINQALSETLNELLNDQELLDFLANKSN